jgi:hypothetical protein
MRWAWVALVVSMVALGQNAPVPEIVRAAKSPYDLARFIDSHVGFDWAPLAKSLGIEMPSSVPPCEMQCSTELLLLQNPDQVILIVEAGPPYDLTCDMSKR